MDDKQQGTCYTILVKTFLNVKDVECSTDIQKSLPSESAVDLYQGLSALESVNEIRFEIFDALLIF